MQPGNFRARARRRTSPHVGRHRAQPCRRHVSPKTRARAAAGIGDGSTVSGGARLSNNCDCLGYSRPTVFTINGSTPRIDVLSRGAQPPAGDALDSLAAGPRNVLTNASGTFVDVPADDDNLGNIYEWAANTGVGFAPNGTAWLVTTDGYDGCPCVDARSRPHALLRAGPPPLHTKWLAAVSPIESRLCL